MNRIRGLTASYRRRSKPSAGARHRRMGLESLEPRDLLAADPLNLTQYAAFERGSEGPITLVNLITGQASNGRTYTNTIDQATGGANVGDTRRIVTVGANLLSDTYIRSTDTAPFSVGSTFDNQPIVMVFALEGTATTTAPGEATALFDAGRVGFFTVPSSGDFAARGPATWGATSPDGLNLQTPLAVFDLVNPGQTVLPGPVDGIPDPSDLFTVLAAQMNRSAVNANTSTFTQGVILIHESTTFANADPGLGWMTVTGPGAGPGQVTTGQEGLVIRADQAVNLTSGLTADLGFSPGVNTSGFDALNTIARQLGGLGGNAAGGFATGFGGTGVGGNTAIATDYNVISGSPALTGDFRASLGTTSAPTMGVTEETPPDNLIVLSPDKANCSLPAVHLVNPDTGEVVQRFLAYDESYRGGVRVATGDVTGDGVREIITAPGREHPPLVRVFTQDGTLLTEFLAFSGAFTGGVDVAVGDLDDDPGDPTGPRGEIVVSMSYNGSRVEVFKNVSPASDPSFLFQTGFAPFGTFMGGAKVAVADMGSFSNGAVVDGTVQDGRAEIIVGNGPGMRSLVRVFDYRAAPPQLVRSYQPFSDQVLFYRQFAGGISLDVARVRTPGAADNIPDLVIGAGAGGGSRVQTLNGLDGAVLSSFFAYGAGEDNHVPVRVAAVDTDGDGVADRIMTVQGTDGRSRIVRSFDPLTAEEVDEFFENYTHPGEDETDFCGAYFVTQL